MKLETIPANSDKPCDCCGRIHRKLYGFKGFWLGSNCLESFRLFLNWGKRTDLVWRGYEQKYDQVAKMYGVQ